ncbi:hypothetical protein G6F37_012849 [Rhizopus arrhizus]|nr:hypothetical protein G6F38_012756 [Rhizopus arrhizus]KAG1141233.1 hypothetical protein G6F37_012849 [Rhizopus arrhizus]
MHPILAWAVLTQFDKEIQVERPICFLSRKLVPAEVNYPTVEKELLAVVYALKKLRKYLLDKEFDLFTDNKAVRYLFKKNDVSQRLQRWILCVQEFSFKIHHLPGKHNVAADVMSRYPPAQNASSDEEDPFDSMYPALLVEVEDGTAYEPELVDLRNYLLNLQAGYLKDEDMVKLRKKSANYRVDDEGKLYRLFRNERMVLIPKMAERNGIIAMVHNGHGHFGQEATWSRLYNQYWWPTAYEEVKEYVKTCHECQIFANIPSKVSLHGKVPVHHLFERFAIDYIGPFPTSNAKNKYIILAVECYSRWPVAKAVKKVDSRTTVDFMYNELFTVFGASKFRLSDNGLHFTGSEVEEFTKHLRTKHQYTTSYHPQTNGMVESINGIIVKSLKKIAYGHKEDWDVLLPSVLQ